LIEPNATSFVGVLRST